MSLVKKLTDDNLKLYKSVNTTPQKCIGEGNKTQSGNNNNNNDKIKFDK